MIFYTYLYIYSSYIYNILYICGIIVPPYQIYIILDTYIVFICHTHTYVCVYVCMYVCTHSLFWPIVLHFYEVCHS